MTDLIAFALASLPFLVFVVLVIETFRNRPTATEGLPIDLFIVRLGLDPMFETIAVIVSLGLTVVAGRLLRAGTELAIEGLFPPQRQPDWPRGVQDDDLPRFVYGRAS